MTSLFIIGFAALSVAVFVGTKEVPPDPEVSQEEQTEEQIE